MEFRTQIDIPVRPEYQIGHEDTIVMLGSCFTDSVGALLERDGFDVTYNPMGPLYNPVSIYKAIKLALDNEAREEMIMLTDADGKHHCMNFASKYVSETKDSVFDTVNSQLDCLKQKIEKAKTVILTLGTAYVFAVAEGKFQGEVVGNCHKLRPDTFIRRLLSVNEISSTLDKIMKMLPANCQVIFTVSPIRHLADGMHGNQISKTSLILGADTAIRNANADHERARYFPSYEIMIDDLRDYRFYAPDMKHPSTVAVDYIYEVFNKYYFTKDTNDKAMAARKESLRRAHRQIIK